MPNEHPQTKGKERRKGPRPKHVPRRMCVSCREKSAKRTLHRIVRTPEGQVMHDPTGRHNGRGAYLCDDPACWHRALASNQLSRALQKDLSSEEAAQLEAFAATLPPVSREDSS
jgi:uncharacterized protein